LDYFQEVDMNLNLTRLSLLTVALIVTAILFGPATAKADEFNLKTFVTVNQPFQVPGAVLQPNVTYVFRRLDSDAGMSKVIRVLNEDQTQVISTFFASSAWRMEPEGETVITFHETAPGYPKPVKRWFYPGRLDGFEFLYSKEEQAQIAAHMNGAQAETIQTAQATDPVSQPAVDRTADTNIAQDTVQEDVTGESEIERAKPSDTTVDENMPAEEHAAAETPKADVDADVNAADMDADADAENAADTEELPNTAGELPLLALLGVAGLSLRMALKRF
jgi:hypothetical protein